MSTYPCSRHSGYSAEIQDHAICCLAISVLSAAFSHFPLRPLSPPFLHAANLCLRPLSLSRTSGRRSGLASFPSFLRAGGDRKNKTSPSVHPLFTSARTYFCPDVGLELSCIAHAVIQGGESGKGGEKPQIERRRRDASEPGCQYQ